MRVRGVVVEGRKLGRKLGFPTANIFIPEGEALDNGVYVSRVEIEGREYRSISNVGHNPTVGGASRRMESYILDFEGDLYGRTLEFELIERIREERLFESVEALRQQVNLDIERVRGLK